MVAEFITVTDRSNARTVTKVSFGDKAWMTAQSDVQDGFSFLSGLAEQLVKLEGRNE